MTLDQGSDRPELTAQLGYFRHVFEQLMQALPQGHPFVHRGPEVCGDHDEGCGAGSTSDSSERISLEDLGIGGAPSPKRIEAQFVMAPSAK
jgi:hypothetical protein